MGMSMKPLDGHREEQRRKRAPRGAPLPPGGFVLAACFLLFDEIVTGFGMVGAISRQTWPTTQSDNLVST